MSDECLEDSLKRFDGILTNFAMNAAAIVRQTNRELRQMDKNLEASLNNQAKTSVCARCKNEAFGEHFCTVCAFKVTK